MTRRLAYATVLGVAVLGCSAYQSTYDKTTNDLNAQADAERQAQEAAHAEAQKYVSVVYFETGSAVVGQEGLREITWFVDKMKTFPKAILDVQGFTDSTGSEATNRTLAKERVASVVQLLTLGGIEPERIRQAAFGDNFQAATNTTTQGRRNNRRVEISVN